MPISVQCPACQKRLEAREVSAGKRIKCPACGEVFALPVPPAPADPPLKEEEVDHRPCPMCGEEIAATARKCRFCGEIFDPTLRRKSSGGSRMSLEDLYSVAIYQKGILWCILAYIIAVVAELSLPAEFLLLTALVFIPIALLATAFVFMLAVKVYSTGTGILLGLLTLIPVVGLFTLVIINSQATRLLTKRGYRVGLMGASLSQIRSDL